MATFTRKFREPKSGKRSARRAESANPEAREKRQPPTPHDSLVRETLDNPRAILVQLRAVLPSALFAQLDPKSLRRCKQTYVRPEFRQSHTDLVYEAKVAGGEVFFYFLIEHLSEPDKVVALRLLSYQCDIWRDYLKHHTSPLPPVIPIVLHHSEHGWRGSLDLHGLFDPATFESEPELKQFVPNFRFILDDLSHQSDEALWARALTESERLVPVVLWALRDARDAERLAVKLLVWAHVMAEIASSPSGIAALRAVFKYISLVSDQLPSQDLIEAFDQLAPPIKELLMTPAQQWIQEGVERGKLEGKAEGKLEGKAELLVRLLTLKFGTLPDAARNRVDCASEDDVFTWSERVLTASSLGAVFDE